MSKLLIDDYPIQVLPTLAKEIGLNEAIVLQQMHYWLNMSKHDYDDKKWIYNSYTKWVLQFPFWSESTVKRTIGSLEKQNLLYIGNYNKAGFDKTKWYSINYEQLNKRVSRPSGQNDPTMGSKWTDDEINLNRPIPKTTTKTTTEIKKHKDQQSSTDDLSISKRFEKIWKDYPKKQGKKPAFSSYKTALKNGATDEEIIEGLERYKKHLQQNTWKDAAQGSTWFKQNRWEDEFDDVTVTNQSNEYDPLWDVKDL